MRVGEMRVGEMRIGDIRVGEFRNEPKSYLAGLVRADPPLIHSPFLSFISGDVSRKVWP